MKMCTCVNLRARQQSEEMDCRHAPWYIDMDLFAHFSALSLPLSPQEGPKAWLRLIHDWAPLTSSNAHSTLSPPFLLFKPLRLSIFRVIFFSLNFMFISKRFRSTFFFFSVSIRKVNSVGSVSRRYHRKNPIREVRVHHIRSRTAERNNIFFFLNRHSVFQQTVCFVFF